MYIVVKETAPLGHAINCAAHAAVGTYIKFQDNPEMQHWAVNSFRKVTCVATDEEFEILKQQSDYFLMIENDLNNAEIAIGFKPRECWPEIFRQLRLYGL